MYCSTLPSYDFDKDRKDEKGDKIVNADDPKNRDEVLAIIRGQKF